MVIIKIIPLQCSPPARELKNTLRRVAPVWGTKGLVTKVERVREAIVALVTNDPDPELGVQSIINAATAAITKLPPIATEAITTAISLRDVWKNYSHHDLPGADKIRLAQQEDEWCGEIVRFLIAETIPKELHRAAVLRFVTVATGFTLRGGLLFKYPRDPRTPTGSLVLAIPEKMREVMLQAFHDRSGHLGTE